MVPFSITCTTCKTRLKVRDAAAIGQILACPKCGGLVMVKPPDDGANAPSDSAETRPDISTIAPRPAPTYRPDDTLPATNFDDIESILSDAPPRPRDPLPGSGSKKAKVSINDAAGQSAVTLGGSSIRKQTGSRSADANDAPPVPPSGSSSSILPSQLPAAGSSLGSGKPTGSKVGSSVSKVRKTSPAATEVDAATVAAAVQPTVAAGAATGGAMSDSTAGSTSPYPFAGESAAQLAESKASWWHWSLIAAAVLSGVALAVGVVVVSINLLRDDSVEVADATPAIPAADAPADSAPPEQTEATDEATAPETPAGASEQPATEQPATEPPPEAPPAEPTPLDEAPAAAAQEQDAPPPPAPAPAPAPADMPPAGEDPLGLVKPPDAEQPAVPKVADPLAGFGNLIEPPASDPIPVEQTPAPTTDLPLDTAADDASGPALPRPEPRNVDVAARLADPLPAIEVGGVPLTDFLQFFQDLSTIPISLDADALWFARATPASGVRTQGQNLTVGEALTGGLKPLGLEFTVIDGQLRVGLIEPTPLPKIQYPIKDLAAGDPERATELGEWMQTLVEPQSWGEGLGTLTVGKDSINTQQKRAVHAGLLQLFEKLRVARGQKPLSRFDAANFALETRLTRAEAKLNTPITLNFSQPTLLTKIVQRLEDAAQVTILIDWQSLADAGWNPDGEATLLAQNEPLSVALTRLTQPMDLTWRAIDATTFEILSPQAALQKLELEFYPLGELAAASAADEGESLLAQLRSALGEENFREAGGRCDLRYDLESKHLLASLPQPLQKKLAALLAETQAAKPAQ